MTTFDRTLAALTAFLLTLMLAGGAAVLTAGPAAAAIEVRNSSKSVTYMNVYASDGTLRRLQPGYKTGVRGANWTRACFRPGTYAVSSGKRYAGGTCHSLSRWEWREFRVYWS